MAESREFLVQGSHQTLGQAVARLWPVEREQRDRTHVLPQQDFVIHRLVLRRAL